MEPKKTRKSLQLSAAALLIILLFLMFLGGCEQIFTYSPLTWAQRDPSSLPMEQRIAYAEKALSGGDAATLKKAYEAIKNNTDPDVQYLAAKVAVGASGINEALKETLGNLDSIEDINANTLLGMIDETYLLNAGNSLAAADAGGAAIPDEDYLMGAAALLMYEAIASLDVEDYFSNQLDLDNPALGNETQAVAFITASGYENADMETLLSLIGG